MSIQAAVWTADAQLGRSLPCLRWCWDDGPWRGAAVAVVGACGDRSQYRCAVPAVFALRRLRYCGGCVMCDYCDLSDPGERAAIETAERCADAYREARQILVDEGVEDPTEDEIAEVLVDLAIEASGVD